MLFHPTPFTSKEGATMEIHVDHDYVANTLADLVRINSVNPSLVAGAPGEAEIATYVAESLRRLGLSVTVHEPEPGRVSTVGLLEGNATGRSLMLNAHVDTVGIEGMADPFSAEIRDGRLFGRGAYDMKGSLAACMGAVKALVDARVSMPGDLLVAAVADEEYASIGTQEVLKHYRTDGAIVTEPTGLALCLAHKGFVWAEVETIGQAAHGSRFDLGVDAIMRMGRFLARLDTLERDLRARTGHPLLGPPSLHAAMIEGGAGLSTYADRCSLKIERRTIPGETEVQVAAELQRNIDELAELDSSFKARLSVLFVRDPFEVSADAPIVQTLEAAVRQVMGRVPARVGENPWMDSALLSAAGVETVVIGPAGGGAHSHEEWVDLKSVVNLAQILALAACEYCR